MNIWIINHHALTPSMGGGTRHYDFAKRLAEEAYSVTIIAASFHYAKLEEMKTYPEGQKYLIEYIDGVRFVWIKTPPYNGNGFGRVKNMLSFMMQILQIIPKLTLEKPDTIIGSSVHLFAVYAAYRLSKRYQSRFIMEVRDLWPQTLIEMGISKWHPFIILLGWLERFLYQKAGKIITTLPYAYRYIERYVPKEKVVWISNGTDSSLFDEEYENVLNPEKFNVLYAGTHGLANDLELLVEAAYRLRENKTIHITLIGEGPFKNALMQKAQAYHLSNVNFLPSVSKQEIKKYLKSADLLYVGLKDLPLYRYGMSMNKIFDYMAAGRPILFVSNIEENIIERSKSGMVIKTYNVNDISNAILEFSHKESAELSQYGDNAYRYLLENFDIKVLVNKLKKIL